MNFSIGDLRDILLSALASATTIFPGQTGVFDSFGVLAAATSSSARWVVSGSLFASYIPAVYSDPCPFISFSSILSSAPLPNFTILGFSRTGEYFPFFMFSQILQVSLLHR